MPDPLTPHDDAEAGDFVRLLIEAQPQLRSFIGHLMPVVDIRADILQEVNMVLWKKRGDFRPSADAGTGFRNWAYTIARFVVMSHQKRARRDRHLVFDDDLLETLACDFKESDPRIGERMPALRRCLQKVPQDERHLLLQRYTQHGAIERKARTEDRSAAALRGMLFRLRIALRRCVEREMQNQPETP